MTINGGKILKNRGRIEIIADIVNISKEGRKKSHIMYLANLSHEQLQFYLNFMTERGLLSKIDNRYYQTTPRGLEFCELYKKVMSYLEIEAKK